MKKLLTTNQICCLIMLVTISNKLLVLPALMYQNVGVDAIWVVVLKLILALVVFWVFALIATKFPNKTLEDILVPYIGKFFYGLLLLLFGVFYFLKTALTLVEGEMFLRETIYVDLTSELYAIPTFVVAGYFIYKGINTIGRTNETLIKIILWGVFLTILLTLPNLQLETLLPMFTSSADDFTRAFSYISMWFGNYFVIFLFLGKIQMREHFISQVIKSYVKSAILVIIFFAVYYAVFGTSSPMHNYAISDVVTLTPQLSSLIKIDWFTVIFYSFALIMQVILQLYMVFYCLKWILKIQHTKLTVSIFIGLLALMYLIMPYSVQHIITFCSETIGFYCFLLNLIFPILITIIYLVKRKLEKNREGEKVYGGTLEKE
ncbi:MAG: GerAB/ArcD/ProY family transporter [Clostridia bacterium]|nr:GerAB/ArcD/ProY family transporter [Clostridia bacterium]